MPTAAPAEDEAVLDAELAQVQAARAAAVVERLEAAAVGSSSESSACTEPSEPMRESRAREQARCKRQGSKQQTGSSASRW